MRENKIYPLIRGKIVIRYFLKFKDGEFFDYEFQIDPFNFRVERAFFITLKRTVN